MPRKKKTIEAPEVLVDAAEQKEPVANADSSDTEETVDSIMTTEQESTGEDSKDLDETSIQDELWAIEATSKPEKAESNEEADDVEDDQASDNTDSVRSEEVYVSPISDKMLTLMESAIFRREILTGELVGVRRTRRGIVASVIYNDDANSLNFDSVTVQINADDMGLNEKAIEGFIRERARGRGERVSPSIIRRRKFYYQATMLNAMLGAVIDFIPTSIHEETKTVIGNRELAMKQRRNMVPSNSQNRIVQSRVLRVNPVQLIVEVFGYEVTMSPSQVTPMAVDFTKFFTPGDRFRVRIVEMKENGPVVVAPGLNRVDIERRIMEYKKGDIVKGQIYFYFPRNGKLLARLPNGCRAEIYYEASTLRTNPHVGDNVRLTVTGYSRSKTSVRCHINSIIA